MLRRQFYGGSLGSVNDPGGGLATDLAGQGGCSEGRVVVVAFRPAGGAQLQQVAKIVAMERTAGLIGPGHVAGAAGIGENVADNESLPRGRMTYQDLGRQWSKI